MNLANAIADGLIRKVKPDISRARGLLLASGSTMRVAIKIPIDDSSAGVVLRELYEGLRQFCEAIGYQHGYAFESHDAIIPFLKEVLKEERAASVLDRYRKARNGLNYYGDPISPETAREAAGDLPEQIKILEKHIKKEE